jgi:hypothetical protein
VLVLSLGEVLDPHRTAEARRVVQDLDPTTVADRDHPAVGAADKIGVGLNIEHDRAFVAGGHVEDVAPSTPNSSSARGHH